jgi:hypothetical protein
VVPLVAHRLDDGLAGMRRNRGRPGVEPEDDVAIDPVTLSVRRHWEELGGVLELGELRA